MFDLRRREFITMLGGAAAAWPLTARAQQPIPLVGFVWTGDTSSAPMPYVTAFRQGLKEVGFVEGENVTVEYRWPGSEYDRLPALIAELLQRQVTVIVGNTPPAMAAKAATSTIPIVFLAGVDPVTRGLVASFNRPGGNATGVSFLTTALEAKRLGLLHELLPRATAIAALMDPNFLASAGQLKDLQDAARTLSQQIYVLEASTDSQIDKGFASLAQQRPDALIVLGVPFFTARRKQIIELAARHSLPAMYNDREFPAAGGLISYGTSQAEAWRQVGGYTGRILKGEKPADLPVIQPTKFELVINLKTAKTLGLSVPDKVLVFADEVIE
jgi:putative ABC transport system substrate-binding protein